MPVKGMQGWLDYMAEELGLTCELTQWGKRYSLPPEAGRGATESVEEPELWCVWMNDFTLYKEMKTTFAQQDPYYISFSYQENSVFDKAQTIWPGDEVVDFYVPPGFTSRGVGVFFFTAYFEKLTDRDVMDFIASIQSYDDTTLMKQLTPALRQILDYSGEGLSRRLFIESRVLEIASMLIGIAEEERQAEKLPLSAFDSTQLHKALEVLEQRMADPPGIGELARTLALNEYKLKAGFRQLFGTTIYEYLRLLRMEKAADLLKDQQLSVGEIGRQVGYQTPHGFQNAFRKYYGASPLEWQKRQGE